MLRFGKEFYFFYLKDYKTLIIPSQNNFTITAILKKVLIIIFCSRLCFKR